jgi:hypothetical protein
MKQKQKGLPSEVAKRMTFEEQVFLKNLNKQTVTLSSPRGGSRPKSRDKIPLRGGGCNTQVLLRVSSQY